MKDKKDEKKQRLLEAMSLLDDRYVEEADPTRARPKKKLWRRLSILAACLCLIVTSASLWLFLPYNHQPPDVSEYADSEYYPLIQKLNAVTYIRPTYKNNFERYFGRWGYTLYPKDDAYLNFGASSPAGGEPGAALPEGATDGADSLTGSTSEMESQYQETTDNQVEGVIEADLIKRSDRHIYYLRGNTLSVYPIAGAETRALSSLTVSLPDEMRYAYRASEMYLSTDCRTVTVIASYTARAGQTKVALISLDVSDPAAMVQKQTVTLTGSYQSSRLTDGTLLLISGFSVGQNPDFSDESQFLPQIDRGEGAESIPMKDIVSPETLSTTYYTVVSSFDEDTLALSGCTALLSYSNTVYVSHDAVYVTRAAGLRHKEGDLTVSESVTEIARLAYDGDGLRYRGSVTVAGYVKDQYSLDEYEGYLRVVTTTDEQKYRESVSFGYGAAEIWMDGGSGSNASLYVIDLETLTVRTAVEAFAPAGETVQSVRFDGTAAYVCTSIQLSDPVFFFDLSDLDHITVKDTGTIEGFSTSLVNFGDGYLLGIGRGDGWDTVKLEIYEETETGVASVCDETISRSYYSQDYKSYLIDRENRLVGLGVSSYDGSYRSRYLLFFFDGLTLHRMVDCTLRGDISTMRAVYIDGYLYLFSNEDFAVQKLS